MVIGFTYSPCVFTFILRSGSFTIFAVLQNVSATQKQCVHCCYGNCMDDSSHKFYIDEIFCWLPVWVRRNFSTKWLVHLNTKLVPTFRKAYSSQGRYGEQLKIIMKTKDNYTGWCIKLLVIIRAIILQCKFGVCAKSITFKVTEN